MKIVLVGKKGTIGSAVYSAISGSHEVITVGRNSGDYQMDMSQPDSIRGTFDKIGKFDALVCAAGDVAFNMFESLTQDDWQLGLNSKLMGQVNLTKEALPFLNHKGSITLVSGILTDISVAAGVSASAINGAIDHFTKAVSSQLPNGIRINVVNPSLLEESAEAFGPYFPGIVPVSSAHVASAYIRSIEGIETGQVFKVL